MMSQSPRRSGPLTHFDVFGKLPTDPAFGEKSFGVVDSTDVGATPRSATIGRTTASATVTPSVSASASQQSWAEYLIRVSQQQQGTAQAPAAAPGLATPSTRPTGTATAVKSPGESVFGWLASAFASPNVGANIRSPTPQQLNAVEGDLAVTPADAQPVMTAPPNTPADGVPGGGAGSALPTLYWLTPAKTSGSSTPFRGAEQVRPPLQPQPPSVVTASPMAVGAAVTAARELTFQALAAASATAVLPAEPPSVENDGTESSPVPKGAKPTTLPRPSLAEVSQMTVATMIKHITELGGTVPKNSRKADLEAVLEGLLKALPAPSASGERAIEPPVATHEALPNESWTCAQLTDFAKQHGVALKPKMVKKDILAELRRHETELAKRQH